MRVPAKQTAFGRTDFPASEVLALARTSSTARNLDDYKLLKFITIQYLQMTTTNNDYGSIDDDPNHQTEDNNCGEAAANNSVTNQAII